MKPQQVYRLQQTFKKSNHFILSDWIKTTKMFPQLHVCDCGCMKGDGIIALVNLHEANT